MRWHRWTLISSNAKSTVNTSLRITRKKGQHRIPNACDAGQTMMEFANVADRQGSKPLFVTVCGRFLQCRQLHSGWVLSVTVMTVFSKRQRLWLRPGVNIDNQLCLCLYPDPIHDPNFSYNPNSNYIPNPDPNPNRRRASTADSNSFSELAFSYTVYVQSGLGIEFWLGYCIRLLA